MKRRGVLKIILILAGALILTQCRPPTPVAAAVEFSPGVGVDADRPVIKELVAAFNEAEAALKKVDLDALMKVYATTYNYHGLKRSDGAEYGRKSSYTMGTSVHPMSSPS